MYDLVANETDFLVVAKYPGVDFHSQSGNAGLAAQLQQDLGYPLFAVHRLDTLTSGLLLFAKSSESAHQLSKRFSERRIQKFYLAIAKGKPTKKQGKIQGDMAKSRRGQYKLMRSQDNPAITRFYSHALQDGLRLYLLKPETGKTHQLRVALASLGTPILGDQRYGGGEADRGYLHAYCLSFEFNSIHYQYRHSPSQGQMFLTDNCQSHINTEWFSPEHIEWPTR
ncbi:TIGR01621 family pseudouridine synthase [Nitrincola tibetensis]|uniref:TIGR01621 family pseudouridine synthase n=1 Tax=Nitrincola tibetensis TaxID=2219697 RepID=A0A364NN57_9GAMM|nr:TIGR01621 family pseudouridine synthase [Nitrincola tibetensis]RAU18317.1 TIGR01621 family pseudouridine synthase [Nitrincola tibetensis]